MSSKNVYELAMSRIALLFREFDNIYISFSGGKDSSVLLNLCLRYMRENGIDRKIGLLHMDYEVQYTATTAYVDKVLSENKDRLNTYRICVPFKVTTCTSMHQTYWRPWDEDCRELWVRPLPEDCYRKESFDFYSPELWDYDFQTLFSLWHHRRNRARRTCVLVGIRTQESYHRWLTVHSNHRRYMYQGLKWTRYVSDNIYNAYPLYDWLTTDIWTANGRFGWEYNSLYDLYHQAGVPLEKARVASPFLTAAQESLSLYRCIDPDMWGKMLCRVNGVNFTAIYGHTYAVARKKTVLPPGHTWESYMHFLLSTLPAPTRENYLRKLAVSIDFWRTRGGCLPEKTIDKLRAYGIPIDVQSYTNYKTNKLPVRMEYLDDLDVEDFKDLPTYKRMCICILKNDHLCKYMGFGLTKQEKENRQRILDIYKEISR